jgi:hypothetical protein
MKSPTKPEILGLYGPLPQPIDHIELGVNHTILDTIDARFDGALAKLDIIEARMRQARAAAEIGQALRNLGLWSMMFELMEKHPEHLVVYDFDNGKEEQ